MPQIYGSYGGVSKAAQKIYVGVNDQSKEVQKIYVGVNGASVLVYPSNTETYLIQFKLDMSWKNYFDIEGL